MNLEQLLRDRKKDIVRIWFQALVETYSADASKFFISHKDPFTNPVGNTFRKGLSELYDRLLDTDEGDLQKIDACLNPMIRIRAVQNLMPSEALGFLFHLKMILRQNLGDALQDRDIADAFVKLEGKIDAFCLFAFNVFMQCKEKIYELRSNETKGRIFRVLERAGLVDKTPRAKSDIDNYQ